MLAKLRSIIMKEGY